MAAVGATILLAHTDRLSSSWILVEPPVPAEKDNQKFFGMVGMGTPPQPGKARKASIRLK